MNKSEFILETVYADNNRVILTYTQKVPAAANPLLLLSLVDRKLTMQKGITFSEVGDASMYSPKTKMGEEVVSFDTAKVPANTATLNLHLQMTLKEPVNQNQNQLKAVGTLSTDFSVPFHPGRAANVNQTVTVDGISITLTRIVVSPSQTRLYVMSSRIQIGDPQHSPYYLSVGNWHTPPYGFDSSRVLMPIGKSASTTGVVLTENAPLIDKQGEWTFKISSGAIVNYSGSGTWTFHFAIPD